MTDVLTTEAGALGRLTLNRPKALNALSFDMVRAIDAALTRWQHDEHIRVVLIDGVGERAFCAGGDIRALYEAVGAGHLDWVAAFFAEEYRLNARIARFPKPIVTVMHGVTMGGGIGLGAHAAHRIVTDSSKLAMPEAMIGFFPDVGGTYLLGTAPGELGTHAALTGTSMGPADAIACGLADIFVDAARLDRLPDLLSAGATKADLAATLGEVAGAPPPGTLAGSAGWIARCYAGDDIEAILSALGAAPETEARDAAGRLAAACPMSLRVTLRALRTARRLGRLEPCLDQELRLALRLVRRADSREGIRAAVIDKDRTPAWRPARLGDIDGADVDACFAPLGDGELGLG